MCWVVKVVVVDRGEMARMMKCLVRLVNFYGRSD